MIFINKPIVIDDCLCNYFLYDIPIKETLDFTKKNYKKLGIEGFIRNLLSPMNIKTIERKEENVYRVRTKSRYTLIVKETKNEMRVLTCYYQSREKVGASF